MPEQQGDKVCPAHSGIVAKMDNVETSMKRMEAKIDNALTRWSGSTSLLVATLSSTVVGLIVWIATHSV